MYLSKGSGEKAATLQVNRLQCCQDIFSPPLPKI